VNFMAAPDSNLDINGDQVTSLDASDFKVTLPSNKYAPSAAGEWEVATVSLATDKPGNYSVGLTLDFDLPGVLFSETVPITASVPATSTGSGSNSSSTGTSSTSSTSPSGSSTSSSTGSNTSSSTGTNASSSSLPTPVAFTPPPPDPVAVGETCGAAGTKVQIWGENLAGSVVRFANATSGAVEVLSPTEAQATVPHGVDGLGPITVVGPGGQAVDVPGVTRNRACQTHTLAWATPGGPGQVVLHVALVSADSSLHCLSDKTVVVLGRDGEQVVKFETTAEPTSLVLPVAEGPYTAVFDGDVHCAPSESGAVA